MYGCMIVHSQFSLSLSLQTRTIYPLETPPPFNLHGRYHLKFPFWLLAPFPNLKTCVRINWKLWVHAWKKNCLVRNSSACLKLITCMMMSPRKSQSCSSSALVIWSNSDHFWPACKYLKRIWVELIWFIVWIAFDQHGKSWMICWKLGSL